MSAPARVGSIHGSSGYQMVPGCSPVQQQGALEPGPCLVVEPLRTIPSGDVKIAIENGQL